MRTRSHFWSNERLTKNCARIRSSTAGAASNLRRGRFVFLSHLGWCKNLGEHPPPVYERKSLRHVQVDGRFSTSGARLRRGRVTLPPEGGQTRIYALERPRTDDGMHSQVIIIAETERRREGEGGTPDSRGRRLSRPSLSARSIAPLGIIAARNSQSSGREGGRGYPCVFILI